MKTTALVLLACLAVIATFGVPHGWDRVSRESVPSDPAMQGATLEANTESGRPCHLKVIFNRNTVVDRGHRRVLEQNQEVHGAYRFWNEAHGSALYVYDDVQNLICRVANPERVLLVDPQP